MEDLLARFRRGKAARSGLRFGRELKQVARAYAREAAARGASRHRIALALGVHDKTLGRWLEEEPGTLEAGAPLREVVVVDEARRAPVLVTPSGLRVEGLSLRDIVSVLEALG